MKPLSQREKANIPVVLNEATFHAIFQRPRDSSKCQVILAVFENLLGMLGYSPYFISPSFISSASKIDDKREISKMVR